MRELQREDALTLLEKVPMTFDRLVATEAGKKITQMFRSSRYANSIRKKVVCHIERKVLFLLFFEKKKPFFCGTSFEKSVSLKICYSSE